MTAAAGATRYAELAVAERQSWTMAGICQAGDVLGLIDGDVAVIGADLAGHRRAPCWTGCWRPAANWSPWSSARTSRTRSADALEEHVREGHLAVDTVVYRGGQPARTAADRRRVTEP